jgi:NADPH:quinone reductase
MPGRGAQAWQAMHCERLEGPGALRQRQGTAAPLLPGSARVRIAAAGVNFPDLLMTRGAYQLRPDLPFVPGMEAAGVVAEIADDVAGIAPGDRVIVSARHGLYAGEVVVPAAQLMPAPAAFSMAEAACFLVAARTARHALVDRAQLRAGETVLVLGAGGGVGLAAVEIARLLGARVIAAASSAEKLGAATGRGAHAAVNYAEGDLVDQVRAHAADGVDVIFDPVGGPLFEQSLRLPAWGGRVLIVGFASGVIGNVPANRPLIRGYGVLGVRAGEAARRDPALAARSQRELAAWSAAGQLRPLVSRTLPLSRAGEALEMLEQRRAIGRIALIVDETLR